MNFLMVHKDSFPILINMDRIWYIEQFTFTKAKIYFSSTEFLIPDETFEEIIGRME